jgi:hypothetical protein
MMADFLFLMALAAWWYVGYIILVICADSLSNSFLGFLYALWILSAGQYSVYDISKWMICIWSVVITAS